MQEPDWKLLIALLRRNEANPSAKHCLETVLDKDAFGELPSNLVLTKDLYTINSVRAEMNDSAPPVEGYDLLVPALEAETDEMLYLYLVGKPGIWHTIYTDETTSRLIGILRYIPANSFLTAADYAAGRVPGASREHQAKYISDQVTLRAAQEVEQQAKVTK